MSRLPRLPVIDNLPSPVFSLQDGTPRHAYVASEQNRFAGGPSSSGRIAVAVHSDETLAEISRGPVSLPEDPNGFKPSLRLQNDLANVLPGHQVDELHARVIQEATLYADERKEVVRSELKRRVHQSGVALTPIDKNKLRSRREAKVHRVKEQQLERALKDAVRWLITARANHQISRTHPNSRQTFS